MPVESYAELVGLASPDELALIKTKNPDGIDRVKADIYIKGIRDRAAKAGTTPSASPTATASTDTQAKSPAKPAKPDTSAKPTAKPDPIPAPSAPPRPTAQKTAAATPLPG